MANQNGKSGMTLADRDKKVLIILLSIILIALAWFFGFQKFNEKRMEIVEQNDKLQQEVNELRRKVSRRASIEEDTAKKKAAIDKVLLHYPTEIRTQTVIERFDQLEKKVKDVTIETEAFNMNQIFFQDGAVLEALLTQEAAREQAAQGQANNNNAQNSTAGDANAQNGDAAAQADGAAQNASNQSYTGYRSDTNITFSTDYDKLKKILNFLNGFSKRTNIQDVNITSEEGSKPLKCTMTVSMYSVNGERESDYKDPYISGVSMEKKDIFK